MFSLLESSFSHIKQNISLEDYILYTVASVNTSVKVCILYKKIYGSKMSKTADLDTISIQIFLHPHVLCIWLVATLKGGGQLPRGGGGGGKCSPHPLLNETLLVMQGL